MDNDGTKGSSRKIMLRPPMVAAVYPPQGKLHGNRPQDRSDRHIGRHDMDLALRSSSKSLAKSLRGLEWPACHTNARSAARGHPRPKPGLNSRHDGLRQTAHRQRHTGKMKNRQRAPRRTQRQRRTEGDARPQKEGGIPEAEMIAKVSSGSSAKSLTQADKAQGLKGPRAWPSCWGQPIWLVWMPWRGLDVLLTAEGSGMQEDEPMVQHSMGPGPVSYDRR